MQMVKRTAYLFMIILFLSGCSAFSEKPSVALALENPGPPFRVGLEIAKPTYTPLPTAAPSPTQIVPAPGPLPVDTQTSTAFAEENFVVLEDFQLQKAKY